jgi:hypothetical protein
MPAEYASGLAPKSINHAPKHLANVEHHGSVIRVAPLTQATAIPRSQKRTKRRRFGLTERAERSNLYQCWNNPPRANPNRKGASAHLLDLLRGHAGRRWRRHGARGHGHLLLHRRSFLRGRFSWVKGRAYGWYGNFAVTKCCSGLNKIATKGGTTPRNYKYALGLLKSGQLCPLRRPPMYLKG